MSLSWIRQFSTRRIVPYITKGKWNLPTNNNHESAQLTDGKHRSDTIGNNNIDHSHEWGTRLNAGVNVPREWRQLKQLPQWKRQMFALKEKFPEGWKPLKKLDRDRMAQIRTIKAEQPSMSNTAIGEMFKISPEAVRRIIKSSWKPKAEEREKIHQRWIRRGQRVGAKSVKDSPIDAKTTNSPSYGSTKGKKQHNPFKVHKRLKDPGQSIF